MSNLSDAVDWVVKRISALTRTATDADLTDSEYMAVDKSDGYTRKMTVASLAAWVLGRIKSLATTITSFRPGDVIPVDGPSGPAKMATDDLLRGTAENALAVNVATAFDPTRTSENAYNPDDKVIYNGNLYIFVLSHYGAWDSSKVVQLSCENLIELAYKSSQILITDSLSVPHLNGNRTLLPYIKGAKYKFTNIGTAGFSLYLMRKPTNAAVDIAYTIAPDANPIQPGQHIEFTVGDNFFLYVDAFSRVGEGGILKVELLELPDEQNSLSYKINTLSLIDSVTSTHRFLISDPSSGVNGILFNDVNKIMSMNFLLKNNFIQFDPTRISENPYKAGNQVTYNDEIYTFVLSHYGNWDPSKVVKTGISDLIELNRKISKVIITDGLVVPYLSGNRTLVPYFNGARYRFTNIGTAGFSLYLMRKPTNAAVDIAYTIAPDANPIQPGQHIEFTVGDNFFLYVNAFSRVGEGGILKVELLNSVEGLSKLKIGSFAVLGDSYSTYEGYIPDSSWECWYGPNKTQDFPNGVKDTWWYRLTNGLKTTLFQTNSYSGSTMSNNVRTGYPASSSFVNRCLTYFGSTKITDPKPDTIFIFGGTNDSWFDKPIGEVKYSDWTSEDLNYLLPAFCYIIDTLQKWIPGVKIINITNYYIKQAIQEGFATACAHYGIKNVVLGQFSIDRNHPTASGMEDIYNSIIDELLK